MITLRELCINAYSKQIYFNEAFEREDACEKFQLLSHLTERHSRRIGLELIVQSLFRMALFHDHETILAKTKKPFFVRKLGKTRFLDFSWCPFHLTSFGYAAVVQIIQLMYSHLCLSDRMLQTLSFQDVFEKSEIESLAVGFPRLTNLIFPTARASDFSKLIEIVESLPRITVEISLDFIQGHHEYVQTKLLELNGILTEKKIHPDRFQISVQIHGSVESSYELFCHRYIRKIVCRPSQEARVFTVSSLPNHSALLGIVESIANRDKLKSFLQVTKEEGFFKDKYIETLSFSSIEDMTQTELNAILKLPIKRLELSNLPEIRFVVSDTVESINLENLPLLEYVRLPHSRERITIVRCPSLLEVYAPRSSVFDLSLCGKMEKIEILYARRVNIVQCQSLKSVVCHKAYFVYIVDCEKFNTVSAESVQIFKGIRLHSLQELFLPLASKVTLQNCESLRKLSAGNVQTVRVENCPLLTSSVAASSRVSDEDTGNAEEQMATSSSSAS